MSSSDWLTRWMSRHPLKSPPETGARYTDQVMARVRRVGPDPAAARWAWPQIGLSLAAVCAGVMVAVLAAQPGRVQPIAELGIAETTELLARLDEPAVDLLEPDLAEEAAELDDEELIRLAEAPAGDEAWVAETLQLLEQLDETPESSSGSESQEEWLQELEILDEAEISAES